MRARTGVRVAHVITSSRPYALTGEVSVKGGQSGAILTLTRHEALDMLEALAVNLGYGVFALPGGPGARCP